MAWKVLTVDDERSVHDVTKIVLDGELMEGAELQLLNAYSAKEAKEQLKEHPDTAVILLDVVMESETAGLELVQYIRESLGNQQIRIIIRTGQAGQSSMRDAVIQYDIDGYQEKTELTSDELFAVVYAAIRAYRRMDLLDQSRIAAEAAKVSKDQFIANMSHQLRTPIHGVLGFAQLLAQDGRLDPEQQEQLANIKQSGETLLDLVNTILDVSKLELDQLQLREERFDLDQLMAELERQSQEKISNDQVRLEMDIPNALGKVVGDANKVRSIFTHLLKNAIQHTSSGLISVAVSTAEDADEVRLHAKVSDTGTGIAENQLDAVFERFYQGETTKSGTAGSGLGLYLCRQLAQLMDGSITVKSRPSEGSTFTIELFLKPATTADADTEKEAQKPPAVPKSAPGALTGSIPSALCQAIWHSANEADYDTLSKLIESVGSVSEKGQAQLEQCLESMNYAEVMRLVQTDDA